MGNAARSNTCASVSHRGTSTLSSRALGAEAELSASAQPGHRGKPRATTAICVKPFAIDALFFAAVPFELRLSQMRMLLPDHFQAATVPKGIIGPTCED